MEKEKSRYEKYFEEDLKAVEEELEKSKEYSKIIDAEIEKLSVPTLGGAKGSQHYLIEHINNAVALQTQRQNLRKDRFTIKKTIIDYELKEAKANGSDDASAQEVLDKLNQLLELDKKQSHEDENRKLVSSNDLDDEIDRILEENGD